MALTRVTAPTVDLLTLEEAREQLRVVACGSPPEHPDDALIQTLIGIVTSELDGVDGWLGRALLDQIWLLTLDQFPGAHRKVWRFKWGCMLDRIYLPLTSPKFSGDSPAPAPVVSLTYVDCDGVTQTLVEGTDYRVVVENDPMFIEPVFDTCWPDTREISGAVRVTYEAGYGATAADVPDVIKNYARVRVGQLYEFRELVLAGTSVAEVPYLRDSLENVRQREHL